MHFKRIKAMPIYHYSCPVCANVIEVMASSNDPAPNVCYLCFQQGESFIKIPTKANIGATASQNAAPKKLESRESAPERPAQENHECGPGCPVHGHVDRLLKNLDR
jgi:putative FmdB family regulatory protein